MPGPGWALVKLLRQLEKLSPSGGRAVTLRSIRVGLGRPGQKPLGFTNAALSRIHPLARRRGSRLHCSASARCFYAAPACPGPGRGPLSFLDGTGPLLDGLGVEPSGAVRRAHQRPGHHPREPE